MSMTEMMNIATIEYFELRQIYDKQINEIPKFVKDKIYNVKVFYVNTMIDWSDEERIII